MRRPLSMRTLDRSPDNELYDHGCDLVAAAMAIRELAGSPDAARAVPAVLGCVEATMRALAEAAAGLERVTERADGLRSRRDRPDALASRSARMHHGFTNLRQALEDGERAAAAARPLASRMLAPTETAGRR
ncbi:MAG TPA: hypothetical protein VFM58_15695 [Solirubrobacteraceae bacterium]|nr:hypothetical protein [Solirubrobacteraceae bacterium]